MNKTIVSFSVKLLAGLVLLFLLHILILSELGYGMFENRIVLSYFVNFLMAIIIFTILFKLKNNFEHIIGFVFLGGSLFKFAIFFILFYPFFSEDGQISRLEAFSFLMPYSICLIFETYSLSKLLNLSNLNKNNNKN